MNTANFPSCEACFKFHKKIRRDTPCGVCPKPVLEEDNIEAWEVFGLFITQIRSAGFGGFIGFDYGALEFVLTARQIPRCEWIFLLDKMSVLAKVAHRYWNADTSTTPPSGKPTVKVQR